MTQTYRFGKRIPLPSTVQILHEILAMSAREERTVGPNHAESRQATTISPIETSEHAVPARIDPVVPTRVSSP